MVTYLSTYIWSGSTNYLWSASQLLTLRSIRSLHLRSPVSKAHTARPGLQGLSPWLNTTERLEDDCSLLREITQVQKDHKIAQYLPSVIQVIQDIYSDVWWEFKVWFLGESEILPARLQLKGIYAELSRRKRSMLWIFLSRIYAKRYYPWLRTPCWELGYSTFELTYPGRLEMELIQTRNDRCGDKA